MKSGDKFGFSDFYAMQKNRDYSYQTIYDGEFFLSYPKTFNDPFDSMVLIDKKEFELTFLKKYIEEEASEELIAFLLSEKASVFESLKRCAKFPSFFHEGSLLKTLDYDELKKQCDELFEAYERELERVRNRYGVACFTINEPHRNMAMWAHYAENYKGFCCKYNLTKNGVLDEQAKNILKNIHKVKYLKKFEQLSAAKLLSIPLNEVYNNAYINKYIRESMNKKFYQWKYENEYRLIIEKDDKNFVKTLENDNGFRIKFDYLKELYVSSDKLSLQKELVIKEIAKKFKVKYLLLKTNKGNVSLIEDETKLNIHNIDIDLLKGKKGE